MSTKVLSIGLLLLCAGCGPKELGEKAPAFGSSAKVASTSGFLEGRWMRKVDRSNEPPNSPDMSEMLPKAFLEFKSNHTCTFDCEHHLVHMKWAETTGGVTLQTIDVDGRSPADVESELKLASKNPNPFAMPRGSDLGRFSALLFASLVNKLELMPDKKRMVESDTTGGNTIFGMQTWVRLEK